MGANGPETARRKELAGLRKELPAHHDLRIEGEWAFRPKSRGVSLKHFKKVVEVHGFPSYFNIPED